MRAEHPRKAPPQATRHPPPLHLHFAHREQERFPRTSETPPLHARRNFKRRTPQCYTMKKTHGTYRVRSIKMKQVFVKRETIHQTTTVKKSDSQLVN